METEKNNCECGCNPSPFENNPGISIQASMPKISEVSNDEVCCGPPAGPPSSPFEKPGYQIQSFVDEFISTKAGPVPRIKTKLSLKDHLQTAITRCNIGRNDYKVSPGLYCTGSPDENSQVLVTCNYKLTFDYLRRELPGINSWIIVLDTRGINVWCAAGKGTFGTDELVNQVKSTGIEQLVSHKKLIVPQLGATGVSGIQVKKQTGFSVIWGPVDAKKVVSFIQNSLKAEPEMRRVTFTFKERVVLIPVELALTFKPALYVLTGSMILSGIGSNIYSISSAWNRGILALITLIAGVIAGAAITPALLNRIPGVAFAVKGAVAGIITCLPVALIVAGKTGFSGVTALVLVSVAASSYLAMNFTGTTPFTSPSGVEKEMRIAIPIQIAAVIAGVLLWIYSGF